jgi:GNAT superfamily N-acetyltransferase
MPIALRAAIDGDFDYCRRLYFGEMKWIIEELNLDRAVQEVGFKEQWDAAQVRIIVLDGVDIGWLQAVTRDDDFFIAQLFVDRPFQRQGIGTELMKRLIGEAERARQAVLLNVVKINPARRLYERLGFRVTHEDGFKAYMKRDRNLDGTLSKPEP